MGPTLGLVNLITNKFFRQLCGKIKPTNGIYYMTFTSERAKGFYSLTATKFS
jgi:hypothetical protein